MGKTQASSNPENIVLRGWSILRLSFQVQNLHETIPEQSRMFRRIAPCAHNYTRWRHSDAWDIIQAAALQVRFFMHVRSKHVGGKLVRRDSVRWKIVFCIVVLALAITALVSRKTATAASPQAAAPAVKTPPRATNDKTQAAGGVSIPDTTLAINSDKPMSQRVVHYEIDAKYDAAKHIVDATEVLTYHNLTGQPLDHFPFHLYQNAFQPKATWVREAKLDGQPRHRLREVGATKTTARKTSRASKSWARAT